MANVVSTQVILDGPRNVVVKVDGILDTSDLASTVIIDPSTYMVTEVSTQLRATKVRIYKIYPSIEDALECRLAWDATTPVRILELTGRGKMDFSTFGGLVNNGGAGVTGKVLLSTEGWATGKILSFSLIFELVKQLT